MQKGMFWKVNKNSDWVKIKNKYFTSMSDRSKCQKLVLATTSDQITKFDQFNFSKNVNFVLTNFRQTPLFSQIFICTKFFQNS